MSIFDILGKFKNYFLNTEEFVYDPYFGDTSNIPNSWKHNNDLVYDPKYSYRSPVVSFTSNLYRDDNYTAEDYSRDNNMFTYQQGNPMRDMDRHPSGFTDIDRLDEKYYRQFRDDENIIMKQNDTVTDDTLQDNTLQLSSLPGSILPKDTNDMKDNDNKGNDEKPNNIEANKLLKVDEICDMDILEMNDCHQNLKILIWFLLSLCMAICIGFLVYIISYIFGSTNNSNNSRTYQEVKTQYNVSKRPLPDPNQSGFFKRMFGSNKNQTQPNVNTMNATTVANTTSPSNVRTLPDANKPGFMKRMFGSNNNHISKL